MGLLIKDGQVREDIYTLIESDIHQVPDHPAIVTLESLAEIESSLSNSGTPLGVWVHGDTDPALLTDYLDTLSLIAVYFPNFADGRGYSLARMIRDELGYGLELRAVGDVLIDQLHYLRRCGFNSFLLPDETDVEQALNALYDFRYSYQSASVNDDTPLLERR